MVSPTNRYFVNYAQGSDRPVTTQPDAQTLKFPSDNETGSTPTTGYKPPVIVKIKQDDERGQVPSYPTPTPTPTTPRPGVFGRPQADNGGAQTLKYPSDNETGTPPPGGNKPPVIYKIKADNETGHIPGNPPPSTGSGDVQTLKFPSDNETGGVPPNRPPQPPVYRPPASNNNYQQSLMSLLNRMQDLLTQFQARWGQ